MWGVAGKDNAIDQACQLATDSGCAAEALTPTESLQAKLDRINRRVKAKPPPVPAEPEPIPETMRQHLVHTTTRKRVADVERKLARAEADGYFVSYPIRPGAEFPTLLTRLPIFLPTQRGRQRKLVDKELAFTFMTPFGEGKRHGPPLTVRDEDTLIALMRLRSKRLYGKAPQLPVKIDSEQGRVGVHAVVCSISDVVAELGLTDGGRNISRTFESVKRLAHTTLELNLKTHERYLGPVQTGRVLSLVHVQWQVYKENGLLVVQFPPVIAHWLENEYTYIDWTVRRQLDDLGKCLHRFLSSQPKGYKNQVSRIATSIGYHGPQKNIKQRFGRSLKQLIGIGWLKTYRFSGNGRSEPLVLHISR